MPIANSMTSMPRWMSPLESATVLPCSMDSSSASSSTLSLTSWTNFIMTRARRCGFHAAHSFWASTAEATAVSTSALEASSTCAWTSPVLGFSTSAVRLDESSLRFPSMKWGIRVVAVVEVGSAVAVMGVEPSDTWILGYPSNAGRALARVWAPLRLNVSSR